MQIRSLSPALRKRAEEELQETPLKITTNIKIIRDWLKLQPHLHSVKPTDQWLIAFLRGCKHDIEKCKGKIDMYYTLKGTVPEFFSNRDPFDESIQEILKLGVFLPLKNYSREDVPRICISRIGLFSNSSDKSLADYVKVCLMIVEILLLEDDHFTIAGEDCIADTNGLGLRLLWQWTPSFAKKIITCIHKAITVRLKSLHVLHVPFGVGGALAIFKMFIGTKMKTRIFVTSKDTIDDSIDKSALPEEYGGTGETIHELTDYWKAKVESYREWFLDETACSDESKRPTCKRSSFFGW